MMLRAKKALNAALFAFALAPSLALAQAARTPTESVTVTGARNRQVLDNFVQSFAAPTQIIGKIARWENGICPITVGLRPEAAKFVTQRVRDIAAQVGAPVSRGKSCQFNIEIVFTTTPQGYMDNIRKNHPAFLGYHDNGRAEQTAKVSHVVQAWYTTATIDVNGWPQLDIGGNGAGLWLGNVFLPNARAYAVKGTRLGDGLRSSLYHVIIVADPNRLVEYEIGALADYIALLALSQLNSLDACQQLPSIVNLLASGCDRKANALSENDIAYLRGLYKMSPDTNLRSEKDQIAYQMEQKLKGR
ncbi:MAG TPA: hypothetical protein VFI23_08280 [Rhizomicrobium sp.]|nr:hypothetical protein [Rhizomicrobium sp.]